MKKAELRQMIREEIKKLSEFSDIESMANYSIPVADKLNKLKTEGYMSDIDIIAQESKNFNEFTAKVKKSYPQIFKHETSELKTWLKQLFNDAKDASR